MTSQTFSPLFITAILVEPLRYFFSNFSGPDLKWTPDNATKIDIGKANDFTKRPLESKPRIIVDRGGYQISKTGLTDNMAESVSTSVTKGLANSRNMLIISGASEITIEALNEGPCEIVTDMVTHFLQWTRPYICNTMGLKDFGLPMQVSSPTLTEENGVEKFSVKILLPYLKEEFWDVNEDALQLKQFALDLSTVLSAH